MTFADVLLRGDMVMIQTYLCGCPEVLCKEKGQAQDDSKYVLSTAVHVSPWVILAVLKS